MLGDERSVIEQIQFGGIDFARVALFYSSRVYSQAECTSDVLICIQEQIHMWKGTGRYL